MRTLLNNTSDTARQRRRRADWAGRAPNSGWLARMLSCVAIRLRLTLPALLAVLIGLGLTAPARAATLTVTSTADSGTSSLRQAVLNANTGDTITFAPGLGTITLTSGEIEIKRPITGPGVTASAHDYSRVFEASAGTSAQPVTLTGLIIENGNGSGNNTNPTYGGGLANSGTVTLTGCALTANSVNDGAVKGGGLYSTRTLTDDILYGTGTVSYCDIRAALGAGGDGVTDGGHDTKTDPLFDYEIGGYAGPTTHAV